jgi:hypothetical protein
MKCRTFFLYTYVFFYRYSLEKLPKHSMCHSRALNKICKNMNNLLKISDFVVEYLREFEATFKKTLNRVSVA